MNGRVYQQEIAANGFSVIENVFTDAEVDSLIGLIQQADSSNETFRKTKDLFAIRQFLKEVPDVVPAIFTPGLNATVNELFGTGYQVVKSIYFDKPGDSNWFVSYHQDLTISVKDKADVPGFGPWTVKQQQFAVQPPLTVLENNFTIRIHLDDTGEHNGALRVIPGSHLKGIYRPETIDWAKETEVSCNVRKGGIMIMRPLLLHASSRTTNSHKRRVIHIEFSNQELPAPLQWSELLQ
ncbi:phytanoyl-CoA dioxygenase family protein [Chitinophaga sp. CF418]|uniref:phytanoyl-CoA dioxygenase family protein n=1 Tax=Chitinophaga sp. CF418 TaxID=1855287 RepID=UPI00091CBD6A|nr:phytanoyl-CoA dioxygenase family protein [Chitinophaga sp. CF418]SHM53297.1 Phytanoyl-CoA dioxygenase (PhyH) [Chitinophaga sp. CF418]